MVLKKKKKKSSKFLEGWSTERDYCGVQNLKDSIGWLMLLVFAKKLHLQYTTHCTDPTEHFEELGLCGSEEVFWLCVKMCPTVAAV